MVNTDKHVSEINYQLRSSLIPRGFNVPSESGLTRKVDDAIWQITDSFKERPFGGLFSIFLGICFPALNEFLGMAGIYNAQLNDLKNIAAMSANLGKLKPPYRFHEWQITDDTNGIVLGAEIASDINEYGLSFFEKFGSLDKCIAVWEAGQFLHCGVERDFFLAAAYWLNGDKRRAIEYIANQTKHYHELYQEKGRQSDYQVLQERRKFLFFLKNEVNNC